MILIKMALFALVLWLHFLWKRRKFYELCLKVRGPFGYPLTGMAHVILKKDEILQNLRKYEESYGNIMYSWLGPIPILVVADPQIAQDVLTSQSCVNKAMMYEAINEGSGLGLFGLKEPQWSRQRKLLNPAFSYKTLVDFIPIFNEETGRLLTVVNEHCGKDEIDIMNILQEFTLSLSTKTTMNGEIKSEISNNIDLLVSYQKLLKIMTRMCFLPWLRLKFIRRLLGIQGPYHEVQTNIRKFIRKLIAIKLTAKEQLQHDSTNDQQSCFLDLAIDLFRRDIFTYQNVEDEASIIVFGAFETTANTIGYTLMLLAMFPCQQKKLFEEIKYIYPNNNDFKVSISDLKQLNFLDKVLGETMRLMAPVPLVAREVSEELKLSNGIVIPAGVQIAIDIFNMHRRTDIWGPDALIFNPDNFNLENKHSYAFIPFTKGIRNCIGQRYAMISIKIALIKLLRNYEFKTSFNFDDLHFVEGITLKLKKIPLIQIIRRDA